MRRLVAIALLALLAGAPAADAKRHRLKGHVKSSRAKAPKRWRAVTGWNVVALPAVTAPGPAASQAAPPPGAPAPAATPVPAAAPVLPPPNPRSVSVASTEFAFTLSQTTVSAGQVKVQFDNSRAEDPHQLTIDGPDGAYWDFGRAEPGVVTQRTLTMAPGTYVLFCPLPEHEELGMRARLNVR